MAWLCSALHRHEWQIRCLKFTRTLSTRIPLTREKSKHGMNCMAFWIHRFNLILTVANSGGGFSRLACQFRSLFNQQPKAIFKKGQKDQNGTEVNQFLFSEMWLKIKLSQAREPVRSPLIFMVHDIGQICSKPHVQTKGDQFGPLRQAPLLWLFCFRDSSRLYLFLFSMQTACAVHFKWFSLPWLHSL